MERQRKIENEFVWKPVPKLTPPPPPKPSIVLHNRLSFYEEYVMMLID
jgi:hypothetical protein